MSFLFCHGPLRFDQLGFIETDRGFRQRCRRASPTAPMDASIPASIRYWADSSSYLDGLQRITNGHGVDMVVEMLANMNLDATEGAGSPQANVVVGSRGELGFTPAAHDGDGSVHPGPDPCEAPSPPRTAEALFGVPGSLSVQLVVGTELPLSRAADTHGHIRDARCPERWCSYPIDPVHGTEYRNHLSQSAMGSLVRA